MGVDGFLWVRRGAGARAGTKTRQTETKMIVYGGCFGAMAGEISPNIMFRKKKAKVARTAPHGEIYVRMHALGHICTGGQEKAVKRGKNVTSEHVL